MTKKKAAVVAQSGENLPIVQNMEDWGSGPQLTAKDVIIPKILLMQAMSKLVSAGKAQVGTYIDSLTGTKLADVGTPLSFIPFHMEKVWVIFDGEGSSKKFQKVEPITSLNDDWRYREELSDGKLVTRDRVMNFFVLRPEDVEKGGALPYVISFRRTSLAAGKRLATTMYMKNRAANLIPAAQVCEVKAETTTNEKGTFFVPDVIEKRLSSDKEMALAFDWFKKVRSGQTRVDDSDLVDEEVTGRTSDVFDWGDQF